MTLSMTQPAAGNGTIQPADLRETLQQSDLLGTGKAELLGEYIDSWGLPGVAIPSLRAAAMAFQQAEQHLLDACRIADGLTGQAT